MMGKNRPTLLALPAGVRLSDFDFEPTFAEREFDRYHRMKMQYDREWLVAQIQRMAAVALEIDEARRKIALQEEQNRVDAWHKQEAEDNARLMAEYQKILDAPTYNKLVARAEAARKDIERTDHRIEYNELLHRGVVRGRRKWHAPEIPLVR